MEHTQLSEALRQATGLQFQHVRDFPDRYDAGKYHCEMHSREGGVRAFVKSEPYQSYDASLARLLHAASERSDINAIIWVATAFLEKHRQVIDFLNRGLGADIGFAAISAGTASASLFCGQVGTTRALPEPSPVKSPLVEGEFWERLQLAITKSVPNLAAARLCDPSTRPWIRIDLDGYHERGLYVDAFQQRRPMYAGAFFLGADKDERYHQLKACSTSIEKAVGLGNLVWLQPGINAKTNNIVVPMQKELVSADPTQLISWTVDALRRFEAAVRL